MYKTLNECIANNKDYFYKLLWCITLYFIIAAITFNFSSCKQLFEGENDKESASIVLQLPSTKRSLGDTAQNYAEITKHYEVSFIRSGISDITVKGLPGETVTSGEILEGSYDVEVYAYSEENKKIGYGKKSNVIVVAGETTFITINISAIKEPTTSSDNSDDEQLPDEAIGTKAKPTAVGDIVFSDGTAIAYSADADFELTEIQKTEAVAVIFYATGRVLGVGLKEGNSLQWAPLSTTGHSTGFTDTNTSNGSGNWSAITSTDTTAAATAATNYPAFNYANTYTASGFPSGWYLPATDELGYLKSTVTTVNNAIEKIGTGTDVVKLKTSSSSTPHYWTSCDNSTATENATYYNFSSSGSSSGTAKDDTCYVRAIREFE